MNIVVIVHYFLMPKRPIDCRIPTRANTHIFAWMVGNFWSIRWKPGDVMPHILSYHSHIVRMSVLFLLQLHCNATIEAHCFARATMEKSGKLMTEGRRWRSLPLHKQNARMHAWFFKYLHTRHITYTISVCLRWALWLFNQRWDAWSITNAHRTSHLTMIVRLCFTKLNAFIYW